VVWGRAQEGLARRSAPTSAVPPEDWSRLSRGSGGVNQAPSSREFPVARDPAEGDQADPVLAVDAGLEALLVVWGRAQEGLGTRVSPSQLRALLVVDRLGEVNVNGLAEELGAVASSASRLCDRLEAAGLVRRVVSARNRREVLVGLTGDGRRLVAELAERRRRDLAEVLVRMSPAGRASLLDGLRELRAAVRHPPADRAGADRNSADRNSADPGADRDRSET
jgi:DNA-binding MarR family transcriptional regulator